MTIQVGSLQQACRAVHSGAQGCSGTDPSFMHVVKIAFQASRRQMERQQFGSCLRTMSISFSVMTVSACQRAKHVDLRFALAGAP